MVSGQIMKMQSNLLTQNTVEVFKVGNSVKANMWAQNICES